MAKKEDPQAEPKFEDALARLEAIVAEMESGRIPLDESLRKFTEGMRLAEFCSARLNEAQQKVEILVKKGADGTATWADFTPAVEPDKPAE